jgi:hypothetical protein
MFDFMRTSGFRSRTAAVRCALERDGLPPGIDIALELGVVESRGTYAGRRVTRFRVFDPVRAVEGGLDVHAFGDLDAHPDLVLRTGHIEPDGTVVITWRAPLPDAETPVRERADRSTHGDDERIVFTGTGARLGGHGP